MKFASFRVSGQPSWGLIEGDQVVDLGELLRDQCPDLKAAIAAGLHHLAPHTERTPRVPLADLEWLPVIPNPDKILCVGINYQHHRQETGRDETRHPTIFTRFANSQTGHGTDVIRPLVSTKLDYEGELAVIIGKAGRHISTENALDHVAGYSCYMDGSVRDWQAHTGQFTPGKNFERTGGFGPWLVTRDDVGELSKLRLQTRLNGQIVQEARLEDMIFDVARQIAYCSTFTRLEPGDVIATGTPGGVGARREPPLWLKAGDVVEIDIERVGVLRNTVADEVVD